MTINDNIIIIKLNKGGVQMNKKYEYWVQDQKAGLTLQYDADELEVAIEMTARLFDGGLNPTIWKMHEDHAEELATFYHEEEKNE